MRLILVIGIRKGIRRDIGEVEEHDVFPSQNRVSVSKDTCMQGAELSKLDAPGDDYDTGLEC